MESVLNIACKAHSSLLRDYEVENYCKISNYEMEKRTRIVSESYQGPGLRNSVSVDFDHPLNQTVYLYRYLPAICHSVELGLRDLDFRSYLYLEDYDGGHEFNTLKVCSIGGGPGTDILGLNMYLRNENINKTLEATVIDKYEWGKAWDAVQRELNPVDSSRIQMHYFRHDITEEVTDDVFEAVSEADIIMLYKFVSAVKGLRNSKIMLIDLLEEASPDSCLIYGDNSNNGDQVTDFFEDIATSSGFECIDETETEGNVLPTAGRTDLNELKERYNNARYQKNLYMHHMLWQPSY